MRTQRGERVERCWRWPTLGRLVLACVLVLGCEARFVDPHPPELSLLSREHSLKVVDAPMVYGLIFDLHLPDASECARIKARLTETFRATLLPSGRQGLEMAAQDLSPGCVQSGSRQVSISAYESQLGLAEARFGAARVRPLLIYFNNVELPPPFALQSSISSLRSRPVGAPLMWALSTPEAIQGINFEQRTPWTYSADPGLTAPIEALARAQLPFVQLEQPPVDGFPLFSAQELTWVREFKGCTSLSTLSGANFTYGAKAVRLDPARPPRIRVAPPSAQLPQPRDGKLQPLVVRYEVEACRAWCERLYDTPPDGELLVWNTTSRCLLKSAP
ncbi:hypothetical protein NR798_11470 [Archangium gephyra]|uniref:hypothetical protein n=1 Tax=Archangium gephyra TaxID=48 RepID=UPI0035D3F6F3